MLLGKWLHVLFTCAVLATATLAVSGCNTTKGVGQDIQGAGETIEDTAEDAQQ